MHWARKNSINTLPGIYFVSDSNLLMELASQACVCELLVLLHDDEGLLLVCLDVRIVTRYQTEALNRSALFDSKESFS